MYNSSTMPERRHESLSPMITASAMWKTILGKYPITGITGVTYRPATHGQPSRNQHVPYIRLAYHPGEEVLTSFRTRDHQLDDNPLFAIGSLVYLHQPDSKGKVGFAERAFLTLDFDCQNNAENFETILRVLETSFKNVPVSILDSGHSYHAVFDALLPPKDLPWHYGNVIKTFAELTDDPNKDEFIKLGTDLKRYWNKPDELKKISRYILDTMKHYDDSEKSGPTFIVDLRWIAHSILELINYLETGKGSFAYLRISPNVDNDTPPVVVAQNSFSEGIITFQRKITS